MSNGVVIGTSKPIRQNENSGTAERTEEFGEAMKSKNDRDSSKLTVNNDNLEATEVVEGKDTNANVVGLSKPVEDDDDSSISEEREVIQFWTVGSLQICVYFFEMVKVK